MKNLLISMGSACLLALCGMAAPATETSPATEKAGVVYTAAENALLNRMSDIISIGKKRGYLDKNASIAVLNEAGKLPVSDAVMGNLIAMLTAAFPAEAPEHAAAAVKSYGAGLTQSALEAIVTNAVLAQPEPFAAVMPVCDAVKRALGQSALAAQMDALAIRVAEKAPDNPLSGMDEFKEDEIENVHGGGALVLPGIEGISTRFNNEPAPPVSDPSGSAKRN